MSRGRSARQTQQEDFLQQNPRLIEYETEIDVVKNEDGNHVLEVTQDGGAPEQTEAPEASLRNLEISIPNLATVNKDIEGPNFDLSSNGRATVSDLGIGVASGRDILKLIFAKDKEAAFQGLGTLGKKEGLELTLDEIPLEGGGALDHGGTSICIDLDVMRGDGQIQVVLIDDDGGSVEHLFDTMVEVETPGNSRARPATTELQPVEQIKATMDDGLTFESVEIGTTGDLEIAVTGISFTTGYEDSILPA